MNRNSPYNTKEFKALQKVWTKKLKDSGFKSIEGETDRQSNTFHKQNCGFDPNVSGYNKVCWDLVNSGKIKNVLDLFILEQHAEGLSSREIAELIKSKKMRAKFSEYKSISYKVVQRRLAKIFKSYEIVQITFNK